MFATGFIDFAGASRSRQKGKERERDHWLNEMLESIPATVSRRLKVAASTTWYANAVPVACYYCTVPPIAQCLRAQNGSQHDLVRQQNAHLCFASAQKISHGSQLDPVRQRNVVRVDISTFVQSISPPVASKDSSGNSKATPVTTCHLAHSQNIVLSKLGCHGFFRTLPSGFVGFGFH